MGNNKFLVLRFTPSPLPLSPDIMSKFLAYVYVCAIYDNSMLFFVCYLESDRDSGV
jgi:hypothetical protein